MVGHIPCCTSVKAQNKPAGPAPTMTGEGQVFKECKAFIEICFFMSYSISDSSTFKIWGYWDSSFTSISIV